MNSLKQYVEYLSMLEKHKDYINQQTALPEFVYGNAVDKNKLQSYMPELFTEKYRSDWEHFVAILKWIKNNIPHYGYNDYNVSYDAVSIIAFTKKWNIGSSCMMLSFTLRDILEAFGYVARIVQACPADPHVLDSHWKVLAYSQYYHKWVMLDPSWGAYCMKDGIPLNMQEIRKCLITRTKFDIVNNANFSYAYYHYLLCRYYFHFNSFEYNGLGMFKYKNQRRINLSPIGFDAKQYFEERFCLEGPNMTGPIKTCHERFHNNTFFTNDDCAFWRLPEISDIDARYSMED